MSRPMKIASTVWTQSTRRPANCYGAPEQKTGFTNYRWLTMSSTPAQVTPMALMKHLCTRLTH